MSVVLWMDVIGKGRNDDGELACMSMQREREH